MNRQYDDIFSQIPGAAALTRADILASAREGWPLATHGRTRAADAIAPRFDARTSGVATKAAVESSRTSHMSRSLPWSVAEG